MFFSSFRCGYCREHYRLAAEEEDGRFAAWQFAAPDRSEALLNVVVTRPEADPRPLHIRLKGLDPEAVYTLRREDFFGCATAPDAVRPDGLREEERRYSGAALMYGGYMLPALFGDSPGAQLHFVSCASPKSLP